MGICIARITQLTAIVKRPAFSLLLLSIGVYNLNKYYLRFLPMDRAWFKVMTDVLPNFMIVIIFFLVIVMIRFLFSQHEYPLKVLSLLVPADFRGFLSAINSVISGKTLRNNNLGRFADTHISQSKKNLKGLVIGFCIILWLEEYFGMFMMSKVSDLNDALASFAASFAVVMINEIKG